MSINGQGHSLTLVKGHSDFKVKCLTFGLYTQVSNSGPLGPLVSCFGNNFMTALKLEHGKQCAMLSLYFSNITDSKSFNRNFTFSQQIILKSFTSTLLRMVKTMAF